jgi:DNA-binding MarR family transcriptional regulator
MERSAKVHIDPIAEARDGWTAAGWGSTALAMANITAIMRVQQILLGRVNAALRPYGLSHARLEVLMVLLTRPEGGLPLGKLGALLQVYPGAVTSAVDRLEADGMVRRAQHPTDGRGTLAMITQRGRKVALQAEDCDDEAARPGRSPARPRVVDGAAARRPNSRQPGCCLSRRARIFERHPNGRCRGRWNCCSLGRAGRSDE